MNRLVLYLVLAAFGLMPISLGAQPANSFATWQVGYTGDMIFNPGLYGQYHIPLLQREKEKVKKRKTKLKNKEFIALGGGSINWDRRAYYGGSLYAGIGYRRLKNERRWYQVNASVGPVLRSTSNNYVVEGGEVFEQGVDGNVYFNAEMGWSMGWVLKEPAKVGNSFYAIDGFGFGLRSGFLSNYNNTILPTASLNLFLTFNSKR